MSLQKNVILSLFERYTSTAIGFISSLIIARILSPEEIGIFSVTAAILTLAHVCRDFGIGNYLLQEKELTQEKVATVLGISFLLAWSMGLILLLVSPHVASFYNDERVLDILLVLCVNFLVIPFNSAVYPLLSREMEFGKLYKIRVISNLTYATTAIALGILGFSYMSLAWASLAGVISSFLLARLFRPSIAKVRPSLHGWRPIARFGGANSITNIFAAFGVEGPDLIIGKQAGFHSVGIFSRAYGMVTILWSVSVAGLVPVYHSELARLNRLGQDLEPVYMKGVNYICAIAWPMYGYVLICAEDIIVILYGEAWRESGTIASVLCLSLMVDALFSLNGSVLLSLSKLKQHMLYVVVGSIAKFGLVLVAISYSLHLVAWAVVLASCISGVISFYLVSINIGVNPVKLSGKVVNNVLLTSASLLSPYVLFVHYHVVENSLIMIGCSAICLVVSWVVAVYMFKHEILEDLKYHIYRLYNGA
jgi:O-antigen/teichoic acid export membrane protein